MQGNQHVNAGIHIHLGMIRLPDLNQHQSCDPVPLLLSQGNRRINITAWQRAEELGFIRDVQFTSPIKGAFSNWGVSHTSCYVSQVCRRKW